MALAANKKVKTLRNMAINGSHVEAGSVVEVSSDDAAYLINMKAVVEADPKDALFLAPEPDAVQAPAPKPAK